MNEELYIKCAEISKSAIGESKSSNDVGEVSTNLIKINYNIMHAIPTIHAHISSRFGSECEIVIIGIQLFFLKMNERSEENRVKKFKRITCD